MTQHIVSGLTALRRQYFALVPAYLLRLPESSVLAQRSAQIYLIGQILRGPGLAQPETGYRRSFLRRIIPVIENGVRELQVQDPEAEVDERLYEVMAELMVSAPSAGGSSETFLYDAPDWVESAGRERAITLLEEQVVLQAGTTGLRTWTAALHLAHHILLHPTRVFGAASSSSYPHLPPILELGAGTGFLSILLSQLGSDVVSTDLGEPDGVEAVGKQTPFRQLKGNVLLNQLESPPEVVALDWTDALRPLEERPPIWSGQEGYHLNTGRQRTVIAADVIYDPDLVPALAASIQTLITPAASRSSESEAIIAATVRNQTTLDLFERTCHQHDLAMEALDLPPMDPDNPTFWDSGLDRSAVVRIMRITPHTPAP